MVRLMGDPLPERKILPHATPPWVDESAIFFITINCLDRSGAPLLEDNRPAQLWNGARLRMEQGLWWPRLLLLMPDHLHLMASFPRMHDMRTVIRDWKHWTAHALGIRWQRGFFDHRICQGSEYEEKAHYIRQNPVRKGLVVLAEAWPHVWEIPSPIR